MNRKLRASNSQCPKKNRPASNPYHKRPVPKARLPVPSWMNNHATPSQTGTVHFSSCMQAALARYVAGQTPDWPELPLCWDGMSDFSRRVLSALDRVPRGQKVTYGWLAAQVGSPKSARAVGRVMAGNRFPLLYPCHRVVGADGSLTGFGPGLPMLETNVPVGFGVLTVDTLEQAIERAGSKAGNKGVESAAAVLEMVRVLEQL